MAIEDEINKMITKAIDQMNEKFEKKFKIQEDMIREQRDEIVHLRKANALNLESQSRWETVVKELKGIRLALSGVFELFGRPHPTVQPDAFKKESIPSTCIPEGSYKNGFHLVRVRYGLQVHLHEVHAALVTGLQLMVLADSDFRTVLGRDCIYVEHFLVLGPAAEVVIDECKRPRQNKLAPADKGINLYQSAIGESRAEDFD
ncbi:hypothetical protein KEM48_003485 [Puccinia striiformis f. sp. tritici PST-130]|nr:hypothetical protein KEM48_003485 [Puccinia striiformis f. sp. tritici PST-130]